VKDLLEKNVEVDMVSDEDVYGISFTFKRKRKRST